MKEEMQVCKNCSKPIYNYHDDWFHCDTNQLLCNDKIATPKVKK